MKQRDDHIQKVDLQTAQNRMFPFIAEALDSYRKKGMIQILQTDSRQLKNLFSKVTDQLLDLLHIPGEQRAEWHMGISDSGKRTIEILVHYLCTDSSGRNVIVDTENYVAFNKFSAATALQQQKGITFDTPFDIELGQAITINCEKEFEKARMLFHDDQIDTMWLAWNSTSTGVQEKMERMVKLRNDAQSHAIIVADAASLRLFTDDWKKIPPDHLPDAFFFSLRKQGLPYEGPNDERHQSENSGAVVIFNNRASKRANSMHKNDPPRKILNFSGMNGHSRDTAAPSVNHIKHLLKLNCIFDYFLLNNRKNLKTLDTTRDKAHSTILKAFAQDSLMDSSGYSLLSDPAAQSFSAYVVKVPERINAKALLSKLKAEEIHISASMHPRLVPKRFVRFAFYPGNTWAEVEVLLEHLRMDSV